jgi:hypothetical protein
MVGWPANEKSETISKDIIKVLSQRLSGWTEENHERPVRIAGVTAEISTEHLKIPAGHRGFARLNTGIVGSNPARGMDVCLRLFCVCVVLGN